jgi:hypothetical protein
MENQIKNEFSVFFFTFNVYGEMNSVMLWVFCRKGFWDRLKGHIH